MIASLAAAFGIERRTVENQLGLRRRFFKDGPIAPLLQTIATSDRALRQYQF